MYYFVVFNITYTSTYGKPLKSSINCNANYMLQAYRYTKPTKTRFNLNRYNLLFIV